MQQLDNQVVGKRPRVYSARNRDWAFQNAVWVDRTTDWGNPFIIGRDGDRDEVVAKYEVWIRNAPEAGPLRARIRHGELTGKSLICWCNPKRCHAEVLLELARLHG